MTVEIETGYTLTDGKNARILHDGVAIAFTVDDANTTAVDSTSYAKNNIISPLTFSRYKADSSTWTIEIDLTGGAQDVNCICVGGEGIFSGGNTISIEYDDSGFTEIDTSTPTEEGALMFLFDTKNSATWRIKGTGTTAPEIYSIMIGNALVMEQPFFASYTPSRGNREVMVKGNVTHRGEYVGRTVIRGDVGVEPSWEHLTDTWVESNLTNDAGLIRSVEAKPFFMAWRPSEKGEVDFITSQSVSPPSYMGIKAYMEFSLNGRAYLHE